jgi:hypothetical protein
MLSESAPYLCRQFGLAKHLVFACPKTEMHRDLDCDV